MIEDDQGTSRAGAHESPQGTSGEFATTQVPPWLLHQKITVPDQVVGYVHRTELVARAMPTRRRLTVLKASAGFGKTTLPAQCCRRLRQQGIATAWISLDERDEPAVLDTYVAAACHDAGLNFLAESDTEETEVAPAVRIGAIAREIQSLSEPFVIAFDELERLRNPASVSLLEFLLQRGPPNLHLAIACRQLPDGLNVAGAVLEGRAEVVDTEDLRFSRAEVARFFDLDLSRKELNEEIQRSVGWPLALCISRNGGKRGAEGGSGGEQDLVRNWIESRLVVDLERDEREFFLDLGLFDWIDAALLDEVLQRSDSMRRLDSMGVLSGLLESSRSGEAKIWRLHPLVREHCIRQRFQANSERFRAIHRRIAQALFRRGETVSAMRHAVGGSDPFLAGEILEQAGGIRLWTRQGVVQLLAADRLLSEDVIAMRPRLALMHCVALGLSGRMDECRKLYDQVSATRLSRETKEDDSNFDYLVDDCILRGGMALYGGGLVSADWMQTLSSDMARLTTSSRVDLLTRGHFEYGLCVLHHLRGEFNSALKRLAAARERLGGSQYIALYGELLHGQVEMVRGRTQNAESHFRRARRISKRNFVLDPVPTVGCTLALNELSLECNRISSDVELRGVSSTLMSHGVPFSFFATAASLMTGLRLRAGRVDQALELADGLLAHLRTTALTTFIRYLAALRTSLLVIAGRVEDVDRAWRRDDLPETVDGCLDLTGQTWWEMEAISCARLRWLTASERFEEARALARALDALTVERHLRRIQMRGLVLSIVLEQRAGEPESAAAHLEEFLRLFAESPYAWPLVQERATCAQMVREFVESNPDSLYRESARSLLSAMQPTDESGTPILSERERKVLQRLQGGRDKQIAAALGLTVHGVRFHLRKLFRKLGVANRVEAVRRAKNLGLIANDS